MMTEMGTEPIGVLARSNRSRIWDAFFRSIYSKFILYNTLKINDFLNSKLLND